MRTQEYDSLDSILKDSRVVSLQHMGTVPLDWTPDRFELLTIMGPEFARRISLYVDRIDMQAIQDIKLFPAEYNKAAHDLQLAVKCSLDTFRIEDYYFNLSNIAIKRRNILQCRMQALKNKIVFSPIGDETNKKKILSLTAILRAMCEIIYYDNHTSAHDIVFWDDGDSSILVKMFNSILCQDVLSACTDKPLFSSLYVFYKYSMINASFDIIGNCISTSDINNDLLEYCVFMVDENGGTHVLSIEEIESLYDQFVILLLKYKRIISSQTKREMIEGVIKSLLYIYWPIVEYFDDVDKETFFTIDEKWITEYEKGTHINTKKLFESRPYEEALELLINPKLRVD